MGLFDLFGSGSGGVWDMTTRDRRYVLPSKWTLPKEEKEKVRKKFEEIANKLNPEIGKCVKKLNNLDDTMENLNDSIKNGILRKLFSPDIEKIELADHLFTQAIPYTHHGIFVGNNNVLHYALDGDNITIKEDSLEVFAGGRKIHLKSEKESPLSYSREQAIFRAYKRFNEKEYNLLINNCENFVRWCRNGSDK